MAEIRVEKKSNSWIWWLLGLIVLALIVWAVIAAMDDNEEVGVAAVPALETEVVPPPADPNTADPNAVAQGTGIPIGQIVASPAAWDGRNVSGEVRVAEVVSDRGFWIEADGQRMFVLLNEVPGEVKEINAGQTLRLTDATVHATGDPSKLPGNLDQQAQQIAGNQGVVLAVDSLDLEILDPQPGLS